MLEYIKQGIAAHAATALKSKCAWLFAPAFNEKTEKDMQKYKNLFIKAAAILVATCAFFFSACDSGDITDDPIDSGSGFSPDNGIRVSSVSFNVIDETSRQEYEKLELSKVIENSLSSIVTLTVQTETATVVTSGVAIANSEDGSDTYIVASHQSVAGAKSVVAKYSFAGESISFSTDDGTLKPVGTDPQTDICVIRLSGKLPIALIYDDELYSGEEIVASGNLLADGTLLSTRGILSSVSYLAEASEGKSVNYLLTDAYVKASGSGGVFLERGGFFAGLLTSLSEFRQTSISAVVPAGTVKEVASAIIENGYVPGRYKLGISVADNRYSWGITTGVEVTELAADGSLYAAGEGLKVGDVLRSITISGTNYGVTRADTFLYYLYGADITVGDVITFSVERGKTQLTVSIQIKQYNYFDEN